MSWIKNKIAIIAYLGFCLVFGFTILSNYYLWTDHWLICFFFLSIPLLIIVNLLFLIYLVYKKSYLFVMHLLLTFLAIQQIKETIPLRLGSEETDYDFNLTSYNAGTFNYYRFQEIQDTINTINNINWIRENINTDILCIQEFYNDDAINAESTLDKIQNSGYTYFYTNPIRAGKHNGFFGIITFSKHPIIEGGPILFGDKGLNRGLYTDIVIKTDTIRVINFHLRSMSIRIHKETSIFKPKTIYDNTVSIISKLKEGFKNRNEEVAVLKKIISESPYKVIACGDLNDMPYSYTYRKFRKTLLNAFEDAGTGFGFTYNKFPYIIRIDNQFYDPRLRAVKFKVHKHNKHSDHYPIKAAYKFER